MEKFKAICSYGDGNPFELSVDDIDKYIGIVKIKEYLTDASGNVCGIKFSGDRGHGYGFNYGWMDFEVRVGDEYSFDHWYTSIDGPSDWNNDSYKFKIRLEKDNS